MCEAHVRWTGVHVRREYVKLRVEVPLSVSLTDIAGPDDIMKAARSVELAAYNTFQPETSTTYKQKMRSLFQNLKIKNN